MRRVTDMTKGLWSRDFTIITLGSVISMLGNAMTGFALSLFVLDFTDSASMYAVFVFVNTLPQIAAPIIAGPLLDRFSRRKSIYGLDFLAASLYALMALLLWTGKMSFPLLIVCTFFIGSIHSIYLVAYNSFYPLLIPNGMFDKAYSVSSTLETLSYVTLPLATFLYKAIGMTPLLIVNAVCFLTAAIFETHISDVEAKSALSRGSGYSVIGYLRDTKEGIKYLVGQRGLLCITSHYFFSSVAYGCSAVVTLPYFRESFENGEFLYIFIFAFMFIGRLTGGAILYKRAVPLRYRYIVAVIFGVSIAIEEAFYLYTNLYVMCVLCLLNGLMAMTTYNMRQASINGYVPDEKRGRFNGAWFPIITLGSLIGEAGAGVLLKFIPMRQTLTVFMLISAAACALSLGGGRKYVRPIYTQQEN